MVLKLLRHKRIWILVLASFVMLVVGTILFAALEGWHVIDALYFTVSTMTTVGFGDLVVTTDAAKLLASIYMILTVPLLLIAIEFSVEVIYGDETCRRPRKRRK